MTKINIYYSFCSILRPKGVLLLLNIDQLFETLWEEIIEKEDTLEEKENEIGEI